MNIECPVCHKSCKEVKIHKRLTRYHNFTKNFLTCCAECKEQDDEHWKGMWGEYYGSQGF